MTYFADSYETEKERRHSIEKEIEIKESELYKSMRPKPPPLFYGMTITKFLTLPFEFDLNLDLTLF